MPYREKIKFLKGGKINRESYKSLNFADWADCIRDHLNGVGYALPDDQEGLAHSAFVAIARGLDGEVEKAIQGGIRICLKDAHDSFKQRNCAWSVSGLDQLLSLTNNIGYADIGTKREDRQHPLIGEASTIQLFLGMFEPKPELLFNPQAEGQDIYFRALQTLAGIRAKLPYEFWEQNLAYAPDKYAGVCCRGAFYNSLEGGLRLFHHVDWGSERAHGLIADFLSYFLYNHRNNKVITKRILAEKSELPETARNILDLAYQQSQSMAKPIY